MDELWDLYDENRLPLGITWTRGNDLPKGTYHLVIGVWVINTDGRILLTLRDAKKELWPLKWENTGRSALCGETSAEAAIRELFEETGLVVSSKDLLHLCSFTYPGRAHVDNYAVILNISLDKLQLQQGETIDARLVTFDELLTLRDEGKLAEPLNDRIPVLSDKLLGIIRSLEKR